MSARRKMKEYVGGRVGIYREKPTKIYARVGNLYTGAVEVPNKDGWYYFTLEGPGGQVVEAPNGNFPSIYKTPVVLGYEPEINPKQLCALYPRNVYGPQSTFAIGPANHHKSHEWPNYDTVFVRSEQFLPGDYFPVSGALSVEIWPDIYLVSSAWLPVDILTTVDLSSYVTALASDECQYVMVVVDSAGAFTVREGAVITGWANLDRTTDIPAPSFGDNTIFAVNLYYGQTEFRKNGDYNDFVDLRFAGVKSGSAVTGSVTVKEIDGTPLVTGVSTIRVSNGTLTNDGSGQVTIQTVNALGAELIDLTAQVDGSETHFTFTPDAPAIEVLVTGVTLLPSDITYTPGNTYFDLSFAPLSTDTLLVRRVDTAVSVSVTFYPTIYPLPFYFADSNVNWDTISATAAADYYIQSSGAQNDELVWSINLPDGTYTWCLNHYTGDSRGIYTLYLDGVSAGTIDGYAASGAMARSYVASIAVTGANPVEVKIKMATKNGSSSDYYGLIFETLLKRTGA